MSKENYNKELLSIIEEKQEEWSTAIKEVTPLIRSKNPTDMTEAQALLLSYRTMILDEISYFLGELAGEQKGLKKLRKDKFILYSTGLLPDGTRPSAKEMRNPVVGNTKISASYRELIMSGDFAEYEYTEQILSDVINQLKENINTIDKYLYAIKNRLELFTIFK